MTIHIKTQQELEIMRRAGKLLAGVMREIEKKIMPGVSTWEIDQMAEQLIINCGGKPAFKGYGDKHNPFPATICASINDEVVHGIPSTDRILQEGDIFKVDMGLEVDGFFSDMARTFAVGQVTLEAQKLIEVTEKSFWKGIEKLKAGAGLMGYAKAAQKTIEDAGFSVVKNLVGHGIGKHMHEEPQVPNYFEKGFRNIELKAGMTLALEPMVNVGTHNTELGSDGWVFLTADGSLSAHYENTVAITEKGVEVLTKL